MTEVALEAGSGDIADDWRVPDGVFPDVHRNTFGRGVAITRRQLAAGDIDAGRYEELIARKLKSGRMWLARLDGEQSEMFDQICEQSVPAELQEVKAAEAGDSSWQTWLGETAADAQLIEYAQWHVGSIEAQQQDSGVQEEIATQRVQYKEGVRRGLEEGWLHDAAEMAIGGVDYVGVHIGDVFVTALEDALAFHKRNSGEIIMGGMTAIPAPGDYANTRSNIKKAGKHEFNHAVLGRLPACWLNEAVTEHIAQVFEYKRLDELEPNKRMNYGPPVYTSERRLLSRILQEGHEVIPVELATLAYSGEPAGLDNEALDTFKSAVNRAWAHMTPDGVRAFDNLNLYIQGLESQYLRGDYRSMRALSKAARKAMRAVHRDLEYQPEVVFSGNARERSIVTAA